VLVGRGVPVDWAADGQVIELSNYPISGNQRMGVKIEGLSENQVRLTLTGASPAGKVIFNLPVFIGNILSATAGSVNASTGEVTLEPGTTSVTVTLIAFPGPSTIP
ncbi:MAG TPA: hypothetical protein VFF78_08135, partial [Anaerolineaceae bacterium]|nr:hypothetical protein [Anaerolineaceae bacterium]